MSPIQEFAEALEVFHERGSRRWREIMFRAERLTVQMMAGAVAGQAAALRILAGRAAQVGADTHTIAGSAAAGLNQAAAELEAWALDQVAAYNQARGFEPPPDAPLIIMPE